MTAEELREWAAKIAAALKPLPDKAVEELARLLAPPNRGDGHDAT